MIIHTSPARYSTHLQMAWHQKKSRTAILTTRCNISDLRAWAGLLHDLGSLDKVDAVVVVLLQTSADGQDVQIKDDVHRVEANLPTLV